MSVRTPILILLSLNCASTGEAAQTPSMARPAMRSREDSLVAAFMALSLTA